MVDVIKALAIVDNYEKHRSVRSKLIKGVKGFPPKISICIPTYKRVDTLQQTIGSCLNQKGFDDYVIIVSDNNPERNDETEQYMHTVESEKILYYKHERNIGMYGNLNRLFELSESKYTVCIHDDDLLMPHFLKICSSLLDENENVDFVYPYKINWDGVGDIPFEVVPPQIYAYKLGTIDFINDNPCPPTGFMCRTEKMINIGGYNEDTYPSNDYYFNVKAVRNAGVYRLNIPLYTYRWAVNASMKKETLIQFMTVDPPLVKYLTNQYFFLGWLYGLFMLDYSYYWTNRFTTLFPEERLSGISSDVKTTFSKSDIFFTRVFRRIYALCKDFTHKIRRVKLNIKVYC